MFVFKTTLKMSRPYSSTLNGGSVITSSSSSRMPRMRMAITATWKRTKKMGSLKARLLKAYQWRSSRSS